MNIQQAISESIENHNKQLDAWILDILNKYWGTDYTKLDLTLILLRMRKEKLSLNLDREETDNELFWNYTIYKDEYLPLAKLRVKLTSNITL